MLVSCRSTKHPTDIRKVIYTTNAIESLSSVIRYAIKKRKVFPTDDAVIKVVVAGHPVSVAEMDDAAEGLAYGMSRFIIGFGDRLDGHF